MHGTMNVKFNNTYCFSIATMVARTRLNVSFIRALSAFFSSLSIILWEIFVNKRVL